MEAHRAEIEASALSAAPPLKAPKPLKYEQPAPAASVLRASQGIGPVFVAEGGKVWAFMVGKRPETWLVMPYGLRVSGDEIRAAGGEWREAESFKPVKGMRGHDWIVAIVDANDGRGPLPTAATIKGGDKHPVVKVGKQSRLLMPKETQPLYFAWLMSGGPSSLEEGDGWTYDSFDPPEKSAPRAALSPAARKIVDNTVVSIMRPVTERAEWLARVLDFEDMVFEDWRWRNVAAFWDAVRAMSPEDADMIRLYKERTVANALERLERAGRVESVGNGGYRKV